VLTDREYKAVFKEHRVKTSYLNRVGAIDGKAMLTVEYNSTLGHKLEEIRQTALYASATNMPREAITHENAKEIIDRVNWATLIELSRPFEGPRWLRIALYHRTTLPAN
jgi:hypothetical protein